MSRGQVSVRMQFAKQKHKLRSTCNHLSKVSLAEELSLAPSSLRMTAAIMTDYPHLTAVRAAIQMFRMKNPKIQKKVPR